MLRHRHVLEGVRIINSFRKYGHLFANLDPLHRRKWWKVNTTAALLKHLKRSQDTLVPTILSHYPDTLHKLYTIDELGTPFNLGESFYSHEAQQGDTTLEALIQDMVRAHTGTLSVETAHLTNELERNWLLSEVETDWRSKLQGNEALQVFVLRKLLKAELFESFLSKHFRGVKRFGVEGAESILPGLFAIMHQAYLDGVRSVEMGMAHRGRLNVLANLFHKPYGAIFNEFDSASEMGDVKYHMGAHATLDPFEIFGFMHPFANDVAAVEMTERMELNLNANPSHLELVAPVVMGRVKRQQVQQRQRTPLGVVISGDASFAGQGVVSETLEMARVNGFDTHGSIHVILNNQIGFTTIPHAYHPSDIAKGFDLPIFHANGDDPLAVYHACHLATAYRSKFFKSAVVDIVCYRKHGHNELDDPHITNPVMYDSIAKKKPVVDIFSKDLIKRGIVTAKQTAAYIDKFQAKLDKEYANKTEYEVPEEEALARSLRIRVDFQERFHRGFEDSGIERHVLNHVAQKMTTIPDGMTVHPRVAEIIKKRQESVLSDDCKINWGTAEHLAFGTILNEGYSVRLTGQDVERGTFNQRHGGIVDQNSGRQVFPLQNLVHPGQNFSLFNSHLSESAVLAFEHGYSLYNERTLCLWEAQFGDFANSAQSVIDTFITAARTRWNTQSCLVLLLPHGYEGQGPDHSSARIERFTNMIGSDTEDIPGYAQHDIAFIDKAFDMFQNTDGELTVAQAQEATKTLKLHFPPDWWNSVADSHGGVISRTNFSNSISHLMMENADRAVSMILLQPTTPANYFHALRQQFYRNFSSPLVIFTPKHLLHHTPAKSPIEHFLPGVGFRPVIVDISTKTTSIKDVKRILLCSGKIAFHLRRGLPSNVAVIRLEQLAPFPYAKLAFMFSRFDMTNVELVWVQDEPKNFGVFAYVEPRINTLLRALEEGTFTNDSNFSYDSDNDMFSSDDEAEESDDYEEDVYSHFFGKLLYIGRPPAKSTATGSFKQHMREEKAIIKMAHTLPQRTPKIHLSKAQQ